MTTFLIVLSIFILFCMILYDAGYRRGSDEIRSTTKSIYDMYLKDKDKYNESNRSRK